MGCATNCRSFSNASKICIQVAGLGCIVKLVINLLSLFTGQNKENRNYPEEVLAILLSDACLIRLYLLIKCKLFYSSLYPMAISVVSTFTQTLSLSAHLKSV